MARQFAEKAHRGQIRKLHAEPFTNHINNVASTLLTAGFRPEVVAAGYLHDIVEDTNVPLSEIEKVFGKEVCRLVASNTEDMALPWEIRKGKTIERVRMGSMETKALIAADKLDNLSNIKKYLDLDGDQVWEIFSKGREQQLWYYGEIKEALFESVQEEGIPAFFYEYVELVRRLKG
ncbi:MAG: HD domain-containing protein [Bacillus sp. (in: firmicutes)]